MQKPKTCILGGTGFVGRNMTSALLAQGHEVSILTRHRERNRDLLVFPSVRVIESDVYSTDELTTRFRGMDAVVNLVGILNQTRYGHENFEDTHVELPKNVAEAVAQSGVPRLLHMSASNADPNGPSLYLQSKGRAEELIHEHALKHGYDATSFRPSVIFGPTDSFTNRFASLLRDIPFFFPLACPESQLQPVYVDDVVTCFVNAIKNKRTFGKRYDLCGPNVYTLYEIVDYIARTMGVKRKIIKLTEWQSKLQASTLQWFPGKPFTPDNFQSLQVASVCEKPFPEVFNITPRTMEEIVPKYLKKQPTKLDAFRRQIRS
ncbi:MAG: complex I NDUFA9 subunit family protein [Arenicellales bacterium]|nr:complex I NDUFA9 subunit family protein [Arenicellales bacterium]